MAEEARKNPSQANDTETAPPSPPALSEAARRALAEADARRAAREAEAQPRPTEVGGRAGPDPVRYGDWEKDGIISDF